jgi:hypothetical protein
MRLVPTSSAPDGARLARDVLTGRPDAIPLLRAGVTLTPDYRERLVRVGIQAVYIEDRVSEGIAPTPVVSIETRRMATRTVAKAFAASSEDFYLSRLNGQNVHIVSQKGIWMYTALLLAAASVWFL